MRTYYTEKIQISRCYPHPHLLNTNRWTLGDLYIWLFSFSHNKTLVYLKILVVLSDGNREASRGVPMDTFRLQQGIKQLTRNGIKMVGALIPNVQGTQQIHELQSIFSEPNDFQKNMLFLELCRKYVLVASNRHIYVERQQERGVLKHVRKTRNHLLIFRLISRYF